VSRPITLAVVPSATPGDSREALEAVCAGLGEILGEPVAAANPRSYSGLATALEHDRVQYAWMSPALVVLTEERIRLRPLLSAVRGGSTDYCAALFVDAESELQTIEELRGKRVAWVDAASASGYLFPRLSLAARGIDPEALFGNQLFLGSHGEVVRAVFDCFVDVGATYAERPSDGEPVTRAGFCDVEPKRTARVLEWTQPIPNDVIVGHGLLPVADQIRFGDAIMTLAETEAGRDKLYNAFHTKRFTTTPREALRPLRDLIRHARENGLLLRL
jgi:phosphonate transport system substrate-binding protein